VRVLSDRARISSYPRRMHLEFTGEMWFWRGPSPYHFITVAEEESAELQSAAALVTYGWGMIPVTAQIGATTWTTSLFPKDGGYIVPVKDVVRTAEGLDVGAAVTVRLTVDSLDVDTTAPRTEHRLDRPTVRDGRVTVRVRLAARDPLSGVAGTYYRLDDGPVLRYRGRLTVPADAEHRLTYWSVDRAGNVEGDGRGRSLTLPPAVTAGDPAPPPASPSAPEPAVEPVDET